MAARQQDRQPTFWAGYVAWLRSRAKVLLALVLLEVALFLIGLSLASSPFEPFVYDTF
jgi:hypothetical protein